MPQLDTIITFFGLSLLLGFTPGPDNLFVVMQTATNGRKAGFLVVLGLCTGLVAHTAAIALGLAAVFAASASAFSALKFAGGRLSCVPRVAGILGTGWQAKPSRYYTCAVYAVVCKRHRHEPHQS